MAGFDPFSFEQFQWNESLRCAWSRMPRNVGAGSLTELIAVLVVDDDHLLQTLVQGALSDGGFEPSMISSGEEALALLGEPTANYRVLVTDINLGRGVMDGWQLARSVREMHPDFPVVYMTGDSAEEWTSKGVPNSILLTKPFAPAQLVTAVSQLLNIGSPPG
jgi:DNA-binding response OmpR family regulator